MNSEKCISVLLATANTNAFFSIMICTLWIARNEKGKENKTSVT